MTKPLITIGITCCSEGDWLKECWDSVLAQTDSRWRAVLVMDGGASPDTIVAYDNLEHPELEKFRLAENKGPYVCRNKAFEQTRTPYHFYLDAKDQLAPQAIEAVLQVFEFEPDVGYVSLNWRSLETNELYKAFREQSLSGLAAGNNYAGPGAYRVDVWKKLGRFCTEPVLALSMSDYDFHLSMVEYDIPRANSGRPFYLYRTDSSARIAASSDATFYKKIEYIYERHAELFKNHIAGFQLLSRGYLRSAEHYAENGDTAEAKRLAKLAKDYAKKFQLGTEWLVRTGKPQPNWLKFLTGKDKVKH